MKTLFLNINEEKNISRGVGWIASIVLKEGFFLDYKEIPFLNDYSELIDSLEIEYDLLMISSNSIQFSYVIKLINNYKCRNSIPVLVGGIHPTILGPQILNQYPQIDFACIGEGERMIIQFLRNFPKKQFNAVVNLAYRVNGETIFNGTTHLQNLDELPPFNWSIFPEDSIKQKNSKFIYVNATRGCPYSCSYCSNNTYLDLYGKKYLRKRPINHIVSELLFLNDKYSPTLFYFGDELLLFDRQYAIELFLTIKKKLNVPYGLMTRVRQLDEKLIEELYYTGCKYVALGIECGDENFRKKYLNRIEDNTEIENIFNLLKAKGIYTASFNIIGFPFEFDNQLTESTIELNQRVEPDYSMVSIYYPLPNTKLGEYCINNGLIDNSKAQSLTHYFEDSILKNYSLNQKKQELDKLLNPNGFDYNLK